MAAPKASGYTKVIGALSTGVFLVVAGGKFLHQPATAVEEVAQFDLVVDRTLDGTVNDNVECICDPGFEADATGQVCQPINPCLDERTNLCTGPNHGVCQDWPAPAEYDPGYNCRCDPGYGNTNNQQTCEPVPCPDTGIPFTENCVDIQGLNPGQNILCVCLDGYGPDRKFQMDCEGVSVSEGEQGLSEWFHEKSCLPVPCPVLTVEHSNYNLIETSLVTAQSATVVCDPGYHSSNGDGCEFEAVCTAAAGPTSHFLLDNGSPLPTCIATPCDVLTIDHSNVINRVGLVTFDSVLVTCDDGYQSSATGAFEFTRTCAAAGCGANLWTGDHQNEECVPRVCPPLYVPNTDFSGGHTGFITGNSVQVTCADGYETSAGSCAYTASCVGTAPGANEWQHADSCQLVACSDDIDIPFSTSSAADKHTFDSTSVTCINGYWDASAHQGSFDLYCAPTPCANEWTGYRDCTPTPCPELTVAHTSTTYVFTGADVTDPDVTATCADGYEPTVDAGGCSVLRTCSTDGPAVAFWTGEASCNPKPCDTSLLAGLAGYRSTFTYSGGSHATVTCDNGFAAGAGSGAGSYIATCHADAPCEVSWRTSPVTTDYTTTTTTNEDFDCHCVDCPLETFANSNRAQNHISGCTEQQETVNCNAGYCSSIDHSTGFTAVCTGTAPGQVEWQGLQTCAPSSCGVLQKANSNVTSYVGSTGEWVRVACNPGYTSSDCTSIIITCEAQAPCHSAWDHPEFECVLENPTL